MTKFDWSRLCKEHSVPFLEHGQGPGIGQGKIAITCPFCDDWSQHMGLSLDEKNPWWSCWRCKAGGKSPVPLLCRLLGINAPRAHELIASHNVPNPDEFERLLDEPEPEKPTREERAVLPSGCRPLATEMASARRFLDYLAEERGFGRHAKSLAEQYALHYALVGEQAWRIVYPVFEDGRLEAWVGRSIYKTAELRYKADDKGEIKNHLANLDQLRVGDTRHMCLAIGEGPMDFLKLDFFGAAHGMRGTCTFGISWTTAQFTKLVGLVRTFRRTVVIYDDAAYAQGLALAEELSAFSPEPVLALKPEGKDPGAMTPQSIEELAQALQEV